MYHVEFIDISEKDASFEYCDNVCLFVNNMKNTANFHIRNLMTGLKKKPEERTPNEEAVIKAVSEAVPVINKSLKEKHEAKVKKIQSDKKLSAKQKTEKTAKLKPAQFEMPTAEKWFAGYTLLDAVFRQTGNSDYRAFHSHVMQNAISDVTEAWLSFFKSLKAFSSGSGHTGRPRIPGYRKSGGRSTAVFSNLACSIKHGLLSFPKMKMPENGEPLPSDRKDTQKQGTATAPGNKKARKKRQKKQKKQKQEKQNIRFDVSSLPHASKDKLIEVRIVPYYGGYRIQIVTDDGIREEDILPDEKGIVGEDGKPAGVMMIDPGLENLAAITDNRGKAPMVIKGGALKSANRYFNKRLAFLKSEQMKGHDPKVYHLDRTKQMKAISRKRDNYIRDTFYKYAHFICRTMKERDLMFLIIGHNEGQKQEINLGHVTNQSFVQIPFSKFISILKTVSLQYGIRVILQEESYTSKASFGARDDIPVYGHEPEGGARFSGKRFCRGLYRQDDGKILNADINGSANTGRKYDERIFPEDMDTSYLYGTVKPYRYKDILNESHKWHKNRSIAGKTA